MPLHTLGAGSIIYQHSVTKAQYMYLTALLRWSGSTKREPLEISGKISTVNAVDFLGVLYLLENFCTYILFYMYICHIFKLKLLITVVSIQMFVIYLLQLLFWRTR